MPSRLRGLGRPGVAHPIPRGKGRSCEQLHQPAALPAALRVPCVSDRPEWDQTFGAIAKIWSLRSTCTRRQVGAVVVKDKQVIGQGYNGVASGKRHCVDGGCPRGQLTHAEVPKDADYNLYPCKALHAEANAVFQAGLKACEGATIYITAEPCQQCTNLIEHAKIGRVIVVHGKEDS